MTDVPSSAAAVPPPPAATAAPPISPSGWKAEPVLIIVGGIGSVVTAIIALVVAFGATVTADQSAAIIGVAAIVTQLATAVLSRSKVTPVP